MVTLITQLLVWLWGKLATAWGSLAVVIKKSLQIDPRQYCWVVWDTFQQTQQDPDGSDQHPTTGSRPTSVSARLCWVMASCWRTPSSSALMVSVWSTACWAEFNATYQATQKLTVSTGNTMMQEYLQAWTGKTYQIKESVPALQNRYCSADMFSAQP